MRVVRRFGRRIRYSIELGVVRRIFRRNVRYLIELRSCKEFVRRNVRYLIELVVVRRMLGEMQGI